METVTITPACKATLSFQNSNPELRDPSFSSYLSNAAEEPFVLKLSEASYKPDTKSISIPRESSMYQVNAGRKKSEDGEIGIFSAEKYFDGVMDVDKTRTKENSARKNHNVKGERMNLRRGPKSKYGTPSTCSELSSNSQKALLRTPSRLDRSNSKNIFAALGCNCYCSDKKSVDVDESIGEYNSNDPPSFFENRRLDSPKALRKLPTKVDQQPISFSQRIQTSPEWFKEELPSQKFDKLGLQFNKQDLLPLPNLNAGVLENVVNKEENKPRKSSDVFRAPIFSKEEMTLNLQSKLTLLNWDDSSPKAERIPAVLTRIEMDMDDDTASDTSSDLFEIKNLSGNLNNPFFQSSQESDDESTCMSPTTCYEPSEPSIEWSVVTESAANLSVVSYSGEQKPVTESKTPNVSTKNVIRKEVPKRSLIGCKSSKAVKVVTDAHRIPNRLNSEKQMQHTTRFQAESAKVKESDSISQQHSTLPRFARVSHSLYMN
ncbi:hypothetical protein C5167_028632 [Papaver somniferum]|uniref:protein PHYTOCHROME KINASE SUBSTRATE 1-like n=1 Tax=Papaver somniferum TaxID=3469 RepID=UPI000E7039EB|nr:protein PHYTOCHROME KINASE SUBSTRATE 1-like [Papaver somniferum]RZC90800.1 hypothetical protein C5167_028632 [Papaver somniferum]